MSLCSSSTNNSMASRRVAVVTGSNRGIGFALVKALSSKFDGDVYLTSRDLDKGHDAVKNLTNHGLSVKYHQLDVDNKACISAFKDEILHKYGGIDLLINNAGVMFSGRQNRPLGERADLTMKTNFFGTLNMSNAFLPHFKEHGRLVNISSYLGITGLNRCKPLLQQKFRSKALTEEELVLLMRECVELAQAKRLYENGWPIEPYNVSKLAVIVLSRIHASKIKNPTVLLNSCCPGWVQTDMGGPSAPLSIGEGIETPLYVALLPKGSTEPQGEFVVEKSVRHW